MRINRYSLILTGLLLDFMSTSATSVMAPDTIAARVQGCATCHGPAGQGTANENFPRIAAKPAAYLFNQLQNFQEGRRSYPPMSYLLEYLHDDYLHDMAAFFAAQPLSNTSLENSTLKPDALARGERLVRYGASNQQIPPCADCHGPQLTGINPGIPGLAGLHSRYISAQLEAWRVGTRRAKSPDCMHDIASHLTDTQITEVSGWLASQSVPAHFAPAARGTWTPPLTCGSQPR